jgi:hypothetical protein
MAANVGLVAVACWLLVAAILVDVEYYDGLSAISNARYFLGHSASYFFDRGPLMAWIQMPAETVKGWLGLHPLEFRPHHTTMAFVHAVYLVVVYRALVGHFGHRWSTLMAFTTAVTSYVFFSYAPFLSHDLAPGALFVWMLIWSEELARAPRLRSWLLLVMAGTLGPLVKQTYGVFWIAVLAAHVLPSLLRMDPIHRTSRRAVAWLAAGAATSGVLTWIVYGLVLIDWAPDINLWLRPYRNLQYLGNVYDGTDVSFPLWIYVRNLWAYGRLATLLLIPGLVLSLRGSAVQRRVAVAWVAAVVFIHVMPLREVRYMAFLAPLSAVMIVPAIRLLAQQKLGAFAMAALLLVDIGGAVVEASRIGKTFYRHNELRSLLEPLSDDGRMRRPIFHNVSMLSFVAPDQSPLAADRYHRIFHVGVWHIERLYGYAGGDMKVMPPRPAPLWSTTAPEGSALLFSNGILAHGPTWVPGPPVGSESFVQGLATLQTIVLRRRPDGAYQTSAGDPVAVDRKDEGSQVTLMIARPGPLTGVIGHLLPAAVISGDEVRPVQQAPDGSLIVTGLDPSRAAPDPLVIRSFVIQRLSARPLASIDRR